MDSVVVDYLRDRCGVPPRTYGIVYPTPTNVNESLAKSDKLEIFPTNETWKQAEEMAGIHFQHMDGRFDRTDFFQTKMDPETAAGFPFRNSKGESLKQNFAYFYQYCKAGTSNRPAPIWTVTGKVEYLELKEILNDKIRLFRNPPMDYLLLEKVYFQEQENYFLSHPGKTWSALGFSKENGGWHRMVVRLIESKSHEGRIRYYYQYDIGKFDKSVGRNLCAYNFRLRKRWFRRAFTALEEEDYMFLEAEAGHSYELLPNGEVVLTSIAAKSGRFLTSSDNTLDHIGIFYYHYIRMCRKMGLEPSFAHADDIFNNFIYSDDIIGSTDFPEFVQEEDLKESFSHFGMEVKEYKCSTDPYTIKFLGATNVRWRDIWVPLYNEERMFFALAYIKGKISDRERTQRISGLAHNLAFSKKYAEIVVGLCAHLDSIGRWVGAPILDIGDLKVAYLPTGSRGEQGPIRDISADLNKKSRETYTPIPHGKASTTTMNVEALALHRILESYPTVNLQSTGTVPEMLLQAAADRYGTRLPYVQNSAGTCIMELCALLELPHPTYDKYFEGASNRHRIVLIHNIRGVSVKVTVPDAPSLNAGKQTVQTYYLAWLIREYYRVKRSPTAQYASTPVPTNTVQEVQKRADKRRRGEEQQVRLDVLDTKVKNNREMIDHFNKVITRLEQKIADLEESNKKLTSKSDRLSGDCAALALVLKKRAKWDRNTSNLELGLLQDYNLMDKEARHKFYLAELAEEEAEEQKKRIQRLECVELNPGPKTGTRQPRIVTEDKKRTDRYDQMWLNQPARKTWETPHKSKLKERLECVELNPGPRLIEEVIVAKPQRSPRARQPPKARVKTEIIVRQPKKAPKHKYAKEHTGVVSTPIFRPQAPKQRKMFNDYLATLVDPEAYPGVRYPDNYDRATATVQGLIQEQMYYFPTNCTVEPAGSYYCAVRPSLVHSAWQWKPSSLPQGPPFVVLTQQTDRFGFTPLGKGGLCPTMQDSQMILQKDVVYNIKAPIAWKNVDFVMDPFASTDSSGNQFWGYPLSGFDTASAVSVTASISISSASVAIGDTITLYVTNGTTTVSGFVAAAAANQTNFVIAGFSINSFFSTDATIPSIGRCVGRPGVGFRISYTTASGTSNVTVLAVNSIAIMPYVGSAVMTSQQLCFEPLDLPNQTQYLSVVSHYRPVSACALWSYEGSDLNNGGAHTAIMYRGGSHPNSAGLWNYDLISQVATSHEGPMSKGSYSFWLPASTQDTSMREPVNPEEWTHPYIAIAGLVATPAQVNSLRLRAFINFEFVSTAQLWTYKATKPNPGKIQHATTVLHGRRTSVENPNHWELIKSYLRSAVTAASSFGSWINENKYWLQPAATGVGTALMAL